MTNNESVVGPDQKRLPQGGWSLLESGLSSDAESGAANRHSTVGAGVMRADGLMARSASSADESKSVQPSPEALSESERHSLFNEMADDILDRDHNAGDMKKYPYGLQVGYAAEMLEVMCEGIERGKKIIATRGMWDVFDPKKSLTENARAAEETLTAQFMKDGLSEDESDGEWYPMSGGQSRIPDNLDVVVFANYLASVSEKEKHAGRMRETIKNGMTEKEVDNFMSLCPMFRVSTDENGQKQMKYTLVKADKMREMMENRATQKEAAEKPSDNQYSEPENSQQAETADREAESSPESPLSFGELRKLFRGISNNLDSNKTADRHQALGWSEKFPCREEFGGAARMLDSLVVTMQFGDERSTEPLLQETFNPDLSLEDNLQRAVDYRTEELKRHLDGRNSDGRLYPVSVVNYPGLVTALFAQKLYETCTQNPDGARNMIKNVVDNPNEDGDRIIDTLSAMRPVYSIDAEGNIKWEFFDSDKVNKVMAGREARKKKSKAEKPSSTSVPNSEPEISQPTEAANHEVEGSQEPLSHEEQAKLIEGINDDVIYNPDRQAVRARNKDKYPHAFAVETAVDVLEFAVADGQGVGFLRGIYDPEKPIQENVEEAVLQLTDEFIKDGINDRTDGRWYALEGRVPDGLEAAVAARGLSAYLCDPEKAAEARRMVAEGISDDQEDEIMLKGKHLGFVYRHGKVRWSFMGEEKFQEGVEPFSLEERLDFTEWLQEDLQDKKDLGDKSPDVRERKEKLAAALKYLQGEISAAMEPGYLSDEEREGLEVQFSKAAGRRVEITPELYLLTVLNRKVRNADEQDDYGMKVLARNIYREFGDENVGGADKVEYVYNQNIRLRKIAENGNVQELLKLVD